MYRARILHCVLVFTLLSGVLAVQNVVTTIAGLDPVFDGDGKPAVSVPIGYVNGVATDGSGNVYFTDPLEHLVLRVALTQSKCWPTRTCGLLLPHIPLTIALP